jgi:hypothetical protein
MITSTKYAEITQDEIAKAVCEKDLAVAETMASTGKRVQVIETEIRKLNAERETLDQVVREDAPKDLIQVFLEAMSYGMSLQRYHDEILKEENIWDLDLYNFPTTEAFKEAKRKARKLKESRNLRHVGTAMTMIADAVKEDKATITTCDVRALSKGGHSVKIHARVNEGELSDVLTFEDLEKQIAEKRSRLSDSK